MTESAMSEEAQVALDVIRAVEQRDAEKLFDLYHDEVELHEAPSLPYGGSSRGKEHLREQLMSAPQETWLGTWGPLQPTESERRMDPRVLAANGSEVTVAYSQRGLSPSGDRFEGPVLGLYEIRDGKFARAQMFHFDTAAILEFLERARQGA